MSHKRDRATSSEDDEKSIFSASKVILRSPLYRERELQKEKKMEENMMSVLQEIKQMREEMVKKDDLMYGMMSEIKELREDMRRRDEAVSQIMQEIKQLKIENKNSEENWNRDRTKILEKIGKLETISEKSEKEKRKLNVVFKGLSNAQLEQRAEMERLFKETLGIEYKVKSTRTVGKIEGKMTLIAEMGSWEDKREILENKKKLIGSTIYIDNDLTQEERRIQKEIRAVAREERNKGRTVKISYQKLTINGEEYRWSREDDGLTPVPYKSKN